MTPENMFNTETTTFKTGGAFYEKGDTSWKHPSEFSRVSAWVKRTKNDLALVKDMYGHPPSIVFDRPAEKFIEVKALDPPAGHAAPEQGHAYIEGADGTPTIRRNTNFTPPANDAQDQGTGVGMQGAGGRASNQGGRR